MEQGHSVSPHKVLRDLVQKVLYGRWGIIFLLAYSLEECSSWGINDQIKAQKWRSFTNAIDLKILHLNLICNQESICNRRQSPDKSTELWKYLYLKLILKRFEGCVIFSLNLR